MRFKDLKVVEITESEIEDVKFIQSISSCQADAVDKLSDYLVRDKKVVSSLPNYIIKDMAYNLYMTVENNYKYTKIIK